MQTELENESVSGRVDICIEGKNIDTEFLIYVENKIHSAITSANNKASQLEIYKQAAEDTGLPYCLVLLLPDHYKSTHPEFKIPNGYKIMSYSELLSFFQKNKKIFEEAPYFNDFLRCLKIQTESEGQAIYNIMKERFMRRIIQVSEKRQLKQLDSITPHKRLSPLKM